jgi:hypothetical protein
LQLALKRPAQKRYNGKASRAAVFQGSDEAFHHGNASGPAYCAPAVADARAAAPCFESCTGELSAAVADKILGCRRNTGNNPTKELANAL